MEHNGLMDIPQFSHWVKIEAINKGWSDDQKFYIEDCNGQKILLRLSDISKYKAKEVEFNYISQVSALGINSSKPLEFGICSNGEKVYSLFTWVEGEDAQVPLTQIAAKDQYLLGIKAGEALKKIHDLPVPEGLEDWEKRYSRKIQTKIDKYHNCPFKIKGDEAILKYIEENIGYLKGRPTSFQHGDFHTENLVIDGGKELGIIDFNRMDFGDPWEEFNRITFSRQVSIPFAIGQIHGYFDNNVPDDFFRLMALYIFGNTISSVSWAIPFGQEEVDFMVEKAQDVLRDYDGLKTYVPAWYRSPEVIQVAILKE